MTGGFRGAPGRRHRRVLGVAALLLSISLVSACTSSPGSSGRPRAPRIIVASFNFPESEVLAAIYAATLRAAGYPTEVLESAGPREIVDPALLEHDELFFNAARLDRSLALKTSDYTVLAQPRLARIVAAPGG